MKRRLSAADALLAAACFIWGTNFVVIKAALTEFSPMAFNGLRFPLAAALLFALQWRREGLKSLFGLWSTERNWVGDLLLLGSSAGWALYTVYSQPLLAKLRPLALTSAAMMVGAVPLMILALPELAAIDARKISMASWSGLLYSSLMALVFGYLVWAWSVRDLGSTRTSFYVNLIPVVTVVTAWWWLGERMTVWQAIGAAAVIAGIALGRNGTDERDQ